MYKKLAVLFSLLMLILPAAALKAQETTTTDLSTNLKHSIGAGAGFTTGYGLSYRYRPEKFGVQVNFAPYSSDDVNRYSAGLTFLYTIIENRVSNLYVYQGNHYFYNSYMQSVYDPNFPNNYSEKRFTEDYFNNGLGFGIELVVARRIGLNFMGGYAAYRNFSELNITGETAIYYKF